MATRRMLGFQVSSKYTIHPLHDNLDGRDWDVNTPLKIVSLDPAIKNLAIRVEIRNPDGTLKTLLYERNNFGDLEEGAMLGVIKYLETHRYLLNNPHFVIIEKQLPTNYKAVRISQHLITYFSMICRNNDVKTALVEVSPQLKSKHFCPNEKMDAKKVKKWAIVKAKEILEERCDAEGLRLLSLSKKKDDLADVVVQVEALLEVIEL
jgi:hypothetical protein